jgi:hypothetical protein
LDLSSSSSAANIGIIVKKATIIEYRNAFVFIVNISSLKILKKIPAAEPISRVANTGSLSAAENYLNKYGVI